VPCRRRAASAPHPSTVLGQHETGGEEDRVRVGVGRPEDVDGAVVPAVGDDEAFVVGQHDVRPGGRAARRRAMARTGSVRNAVAMRSPAAISTISSQRGRPPAAADPGCGWLLAVGAGVWAGAGADVHPRAAAGGRADARGRAGDGARVGVVARPWAGGVGGAGCDAGEVGAGRAAGGAGRGIASAVPARIRSGSGPIARRLAAYRAGQPPRTTVAAAMPDRASPGATV
jgi:hypothetical protein